MPELKHISPLLDGFITGQAISSHDGVCCYPAIREETAEKYIVKVISIPASFVQTEALLLTGAFEDANAVHKYYGELADGTVREANVLSELSQLEGFLGYEQVQVAEKDEGDGFDIYLLSPYRQSMESVMEKEVLTHLAIVNMGLDLCNALAACRRAGYVCTDLKPSNVFRDDKAGFCIGDLGFVSLADLKYASLPSKYCSSYTAPEVRDPLAELNATMDIYSLGLILYAAYNGGQMPLTEDGFADPSPAPLYADYEMAEIILKACASDPAQRWQEPVQLGQALVAYMQRNSVNDVPIIPPAVEIPEPEPEAPEEFLPEDADDDEAMLADIPDGEDTEIPEEPGDAGDLLAQADELMALVPPVPVVAPEPIDVPMPEPIVLEDPEPELPEEESAQEQDVPEEASAEEAAEQEETDAIAAPVPQPEEAEEETEEPADDIEEEDEEEAAPVVKKRKSVKWLLAPILLLLIAAIVFGSWFFYHRYYLQNVDNLVIEGTENSIIVKITSQIDETLLKVICTDTYGNKSTSSVSAGIAVFDNLNPQTRYTVIVQISGFHQLTGKTMESYTTSAQTDVLTFEAITGPVDGSVILSFTTNGPVPSGWNILCQANGEEDVTQAFTGERVTVTDLAVGKEYTFTLQTEDDLYLAGLTTIKYVASKVIYAQELTITECRNGMLTVTWSAPQGVTVESWTVRCSDGSGYGQTITTSDTTCTFTGMDHSTPCSVEVTAGGMTESVVTSITANPITIWGFPFTVKEGEGIELRWTYTDVAPEGGWNLIWIVDGSAPQVIACDSNTAVIPLYIPGGVYEFTVEAADGTFIFGNTFTLELPEADKFNRFLVSADDMTCRLFRIPQVDAWSADDLTDEDFLSDFAQGTLAGILVELTAAPEPSEEAMEITCVFHNADGVFLKTETRSMVWNDMWSSEDCVLLLPALPEAPGEYTVCVYFDGAYVAELRFTVTE